MMESQKKEESRMQKWYNEKKLIKEMKFQMRKKLEQETKDTGKTLQKTITKTKYKVQKTLVLMQIYRN